MLLSLSGNRLSGKVMSNPPSLGVRDQISKVPLSFAMVPHEWLEGKLIQPSRNIPKAFESWPIWRMAAMSNASGAVLSKVIPCIGFSTLKIAPLFYSSTIGTSKILVRGVTLGGVTFPLDLLDINVTSGNIEVGTGVTVDGGASGLVEQKAYQMKPINIDISGMCSIQLLAVVGTGILDINLGVY